MKIHVSHSKKELCEICEVFDLDIPKYKELLKKELCPAILYKLTTIDEIPSDNAFYYIDNKEELIEYLTTPNQSKNLTIKEKDKIMLVAKKIIAYVNNGYWLSCSDFDDWDILMEKAKEVASYGDIPTCRRAITLLNNDLKMDKKIELVISPRVRKLLDKKIALKQQLNTKFIIKHAPPGKPFIVTFD
jgi:hypothetical protein|tara:strand:+ start:4414 stop:4977 length:564 start_codon:yes stop_codon:yes gene_type:complete